MKKFLTFAFFLLSMVTLSACSGDRVAPELSGIEDKIEIKCGEKFNLVSYLIDNLMIIDETKDGNKNYKLSDLSYEIECDENIYDSKTGEINTGEFGNYDVNLTVKDEAGNASTKSFTLFLNPLEIEKGYYLYKNSEQDENYSLLGYFSYKNTSQKPYLVTNIKIEYLDSDGVVVCSTDLVDYGLEYVDAGKIGFGNDTFAGTNAVITSTDDIADVNVEIEYTKTEESHNTSLEVDDVNMIKSYQYNVSGFAGETVITNPYEKDVEYFDLVIGMYDSDNKLIGTMISLSSASISANSKAKDIAAWLPDSNDIPSQTVSMVASARVTKFADEY